MYRNVSSYNIEYKVTCLCLRYLANMHLTKHISTCNLKGQLRIFHFLSSRLSEKIRKGRHPFMKGAVFYILSSSETIYFEFHSIGRKENNILTFNRLKKNFLKGNKMIDHVT